MKYIKKARLTPKAKISVVLSAFLTVMIVTAIIISSLTGNTESTPTVTEPPAVIEGEARQNGLALAYPSINSKLDIKFINIRNETGEYGFMAYEGESYHTMYYVNSLGEQVVYYPEICTEDPDFNYSSLFAIDTTDGYGQYTIIDYLCAALQTPYFETRIPIETDPAKREAQLKNFGFDPEKKNEVYFTYETDLGESINRGIKIGEKSVTGNGYYFIVYDNGTERPYIYSSLNNYYSYAVSSMNVFVKPLLVAEGLKEDGLYGPYLTTGYYQWLNHFHDGSCECDKYTCECGGNCEEDNCSCSDTCRVTKVEEESKVIAFVDTITPVISNDASSDSTVSSGYEYSEIELWTYKEQLEKLMSSTKFLPSYDSKNYERAIAALKGREIGDYTGKEIVYSLVAPAMLIDFADNESVRYEYKISVIKSVITDSTDITETGTPVGDEYDLVKVVYTATVNGEAVSVHPLCAVIDLSSSGISDEARAEIRAAVIGEPVDISFAVDYTVENAIRKISKYKITEIINIFDADGKEAKTVTDSSIVGYRYEVYVDGVMAGEATYWLDLSEVTTDDEDLKIKKALIGKKAGRVELEFDEHHAYYEYFLGFTTQTIQKIDSFVTRELIVAFQFQNSSKRDPYYGESLYKNLLTDERKLYGLNSSICEKAVKILGGLTDENTNSAAAGLSGDGVVAIGLTPDVMKKYGLYAYTVYFELPRGITAYEPDGEDNIYNEKLDDYSYRSTLGANLYISEVDPETNTRYIASDLYGVVTRVPADDFAYLKYDFESFWARRSIIFLDILDIDTITVEFSMDDLKGGYSFELTQPKTTNDALGVFVTPYGECTENEFIKFINDPKNKDHVVNGGTSLKTFYLYTSDADEEAHKDALPDSLGALCFKDLMGITYLVTYTDILPDEVRDDPLDPDDLIMKMTLKLNESSPYASPYTYVYGFYRIDDRRVRVSIHQEDLSGNVVTESVADFYISTFAMKKIVNSYLAVLNAELLDPDVGYAD